MRKAPAPEGRPGFIRIGSVREGDPNGAKGLHHINAVDCVTQWQVVATVRTISEAHLLPVIERMLKQFPFRILSIRADNGHEYINHRAARLLDKLRVEFTRSRPRHSNDNGLAETTNAAVVRKIFGCAHWRSPRTPQGRCPPTAPSSTYPQPSISLNKPRKTNTPKL